MRIFTSAATAAVIAAGFVAAAAIAQPVSTNIRVTYGDLNLASKAGQQMLARRINAAANSVCGVNANERSLALRANSARCYNSALSGTRTAIAMATAPVLASR